MNSNFSCGFKSDIRPLLNKQLNSIRKNELKKTLQKISPNTPSANLNKNELINQLTKQLLINIEKFKQSENGVSEAIQYIKKWYLTQFGQVIKSFSIEAFQALIAKQFTGQSDLSSNGLRKLKSSQTLVNNLWTQDKFEEYPCICPKGPASLCGSKFQQNCYKCGVLFHPDCLWGRSKDNKLSQTLPECPSCFLMNCVPHKKIQKVLFAGYLMTSKQNKIQFLIEFPMTTEIKNDKKFLIEARCMRINSLSDHNRYEITWPDNSTVFLNSKKVSQYKPLTASSALKRRIDEQLVLDKTITYCDELQRLVIEQKHERQASSSKYEYASHFVMIFAVSIQKKEDLLQKFKQSRLSVQQSKEILKNYLSCKSTNDIQVEKINIILMCPLYFNRISIPVRSKHCSSHFQPFDLNNFIEANRTSGKGITLKYKCPICKKRAYDLLVDEYLLELINSNGNGQNFSEITFRADGEPHFEQEELSDGESEEDNNKKGGDVLVNQQGQYDKDKENGVCEQVMQVQGQRQLGKLIADSELQKEIVMIDLEDEQQDQGSIQKSVQKDMQSNMIGRQDRQGEIDGTVTMIKNSQIEQQQIATSGNNCYSNDIKHSINNQILPRPPHLILQQQQKHTQPQQQSHEPFPIKRKSEKHSGSPQTNNNTSKDTSIAKSNLSSSNNSSINGNNQNNKIIVNRSSMEVMSEVIRRQVKKNETEKEIIRLLSNNLLTTEINSKLKSNPNIINNTSVLSVNHSNNSANNVVTNSSNNNNNTSMIGLMNNKHVTVGTDGLLTEDIYRNNNNKSGSVENQQQEKTTQNSMRDNSKISNGSINELDKINRVVQLAGQSSFNCQRQSQNSTIFNNNNIINNNNKITSLIQPHRPLLPTESRLQLSNPTTDNNSSNKQPHSNTTPNKQNKQALQKPTHYQPIEISSDDNDDQQYEQYIALQQEQKGQQKQNPSVNNKTNNNIQLDSRTGLQSENRNNNINSKLAVTPMTMKHQVYTINKMVKRAIRKSTNNNNSTKPNQQCQQSQTNMKSHLTNSSKTIIDRKTNDNSANGGKKITTDQQSIISKDKDSGSGNKQTIWQHIIMTNQNKIKKSHIQSGAKTITNTKGFQLKSSNNKEYKSNKLPQQLRDGQALDRSVKNILCNQSIQDSVQGGRGMQKVGRKEGKSDRINDGEGEGGIYEQDDKEDINFQDDGQSQYSVEVILEEQDPFKIITSKGDQRQQSQQQQQQQEQQSSYSEYAIDQSYDRDGNCNVNSPSQAKRDQHQNAKQMKAKTKNATNNNVGRPYINPNVKRSFITEINSILTGVNSTGKKKIKINRQVNGDDQKIQQQNKVKDSSQRQQLQETIYYEDESYVSSDQKNNIKITTNGDLPNTRTLIQKSSQSLQITNQQQKGIKSFQKPTLNKNDIDNPIQLIDDDEDGDDCLSQNQQQQEQQHVTNHSHHRVSQNSINNNNNNNNGENIKNNNLNNNNNIVKSNNLNLNIEKNSIYPTVMHGSYQEQLCQLKEQMQKNRLTLQKYSKLYTTKSITQQDQNLFYHLLQQLNSLNNHQIF